MKITKGFQNMGTDVKLLFKQLESRSALRAIPHFPHRPLVVQKIKYVELILLMLAVNAFHSVSISFRLGFVPQPNLTSFLLHCKHTPQHRTVSVVSFLSIPQAPFIQSVTTQTLFQRISNGIYFFLR
jgi:hypothetical protein